MAASSDNPIPSLASLSINIGMIDSNSEPTTDACLVHLKLLHCFETLKQKIGTQDGLWQIFDTRAAATGSSTAGVLAILREKRWSVYVARAVDRYESWFKALAAGSSEEGEEVQRVTEGMVVGKDPDEKYSGFVNGEGENVWADRGLIPVDVLMVWHAHMLNPRYYLEDCMRHGTQIQWNMGMPWSLINLAIDDATFAYSPPNNKQAQEQWSKLTGRPWKNEEEEMLKKVQCPSCSFFFEVPWTTCGMSEDTDLSFKPGVIGEGYGDGSFQATCTCGTKIDYESLKVKRMMDELKNLVNKDLPMPGTLWDLETGVPERTTADNARLFPNRLARKALLARVLDMARPGRDTENPVTMIWIRDAVEKILEDEDLVKDIGGAEMKVSAYFKLSREPRMHIRKMMAPYWQTPSPFSLDLTGAVVRQGGFSEKMCKIDWLHSPAARNTMDRLLVKYERFIGLILESKGELAVPTLDVDLGWHTHQLSPQAYFHYCTSKGEVGKKPVFIDHNDRVDEDRLADAFEWTCKEYQERFGEVYSECTCWYCESVRATLVNSASKLFKTSKQEKVLKEFHSSGKSSLPTSKPPAAAHMSTHPSVRSDESEGRRRTNYRRRVVVYRHINEGFVKATKAFSKRAKKRGDAEAVFKRLPEEREHWGHRVQAKGPWTHPEHLRKDIYPLGAPAQVPQGPEKPGACASGSCGGAGGCGNGAVGMCGAGCTGTYSQLGGASCGGAMG